MLITRYLIQKHRLFGEMKWYLFPKSESKVCCIEKYKQFLLKNGRNTSFSFVLKRPGLKRLRALDLSGYGSGTAAFGLQYLGVAISKVQQCYCLYHNLDFRKVRDLYTTIVFCYIHLILTALLRITLHCVTNSVSLMQAHSALRI